MIDKIVDTDRLKKKRVAFVDFYHVIRDGKKTLTRGFSENGNLIQRGSYFFVFVGLPEYSKDINAVDTTVLNLELHLETYACNRLVRRCKAAERRLERLKP